MNPIAFNNSYVTLGESFYEKRRPTPVNEPFLIKYNHELAGWLGLPAISPDEGAALFSGNRVPDGADPVAMAYAGHQFGHFNPQLGDGRALLLGEIISPDGVRFDMQLKGSGRTYFSRNGDGRAALGPVLREYLVSEAMAKLGVPTTRALAAVATGDEVARERLLPGGVITRIAESFVRVGTFEYFSSRGDTKAVQMLADYILKRNYPDIVNNQNLYADLLQAVVSRQARLIAKWMQLGFIHGVMNTDNMSISGETIDYGPCAFMDAYDHQQVFSSIDRYGRYAYNNQPSIALWNLTRLAETLLPFLADQVEEAVEIAKQILDSFIETYQRAWLDGMRIKLGIFNFSDETVNDDKALIDELLDIMNSNKSDFTLTFYYLSGLSENAGEKDETIKGLFKNSPQFDNWIKKWRLRLKEESCDNNERKNKMRTVNPVYIPRNHQIEAAIRAAEDHGDYSVFNRLHDVLQRPYHEQNGKERYMLPPEAHEIVKQTFCGT